MPPSLLPAALLSQAATAKVAASIMLGDSLPTFESGRTACSDLTITSTIKFTFTVHDQ